MPATRVRAALSALAMTAAALLIPAGSALAQSPPTFQEYPLRDRVFGPGGAVFPDYVTPSEYGVTFMTGGTGTRSALFAAGTSDYNCQQTQIPTIQVLSAPPGGKVQIRFGAFTASAIDGGYTTRCLGRPAKGLIVSFKGKAAPGSRIALRVIYPPRGVWYDHVIPVPAQ
ncbi:hypothetical protein EZH22_19390 [Xanthobacter dioxanivorans]|uniref:Secreted protein n=1 Tax=Xanthobacter dioxanivorans TaxID=2528964 RepID=A0A974PKH5_9HYPH|nr:hypothetical protein [Xanthobacter dioxanivorans]QRG05250.1 hypothetical protein EZH22_19390 [Xanthobacter dioxanivorans]